MLNKYIYDIDYSIATLLSKTTKELGYREVKKLIESSDYLGKFISRDVYNYHIKKMRERGELLPSTKNLKRGQKNPLKLDDKTEQEIKLKIYDIKSIESNHEFLKQKFTKEQIRKFAYQFLFFALDSEYYFHISTYESGVRKLSVKKIKKNYFYSTELFSYFKYGVKLIDSLIESLHKENIIEFTKKDDDILLTFTDENFKNFIQECKSSFDTLIYLRMSKLWQNIRRPNKEEGSWLKSIFGERDANEKIDFVCRNLKENKKQSMYDSKYKRKIKKEIDIFDISIYSTNYILLIEKYKKIQNKHPVFFNMILDIIYPQFYLRQLKKLNNIKEIANKAKNKKRRYSKYKHLTKIPKIKSVLLNDSVSIVG